MVLMMNKNLPAFLGHMLQEHGLPDQFIKDLLQCSCEASMLAEVSKCLWDGKTRTLTTADKAKWDKEVKAFESASWFKDEFGLLAKASGKEKDYMAPKALYNLEGAGSIKTIHDHLDKMKEVSKSADKQKMKEAKNKSADNQKKKKKKDEVIELSSGKSSDESSASESSSSSPSRGSTSQSSRDSEESSSSNKRSRSKGKQGGKFAMGAARGR